MNVKIANKLYELRKKSGLSQEELADKLGVSRQSVSKWERAEASPDTDNLIMLSKIYNVSLDQIISDEDILEADEVTASDNDEININIAKGKKKKEKKDVIVEAISSSLYLIAVIAFLLIGFLTHVWNPTWVLFLVAIVLESTIKAILRKNIYKFNYPVFVTAIFFFFSVEFGIWHPLWVIFITIPIYYYVLKMFCAKRYIDDDDVVIVKNCDDCDDDGNVTININDDGINIKKNNTK